MPNLNAHVDSNLNIVIIYQGLKNTYCLWVWVLLNILKPIKISTLGILNVSTYIPLNWDLRLPPSHLGLLMPLSQWFSAFLKLEPFNIQFLMLWWPSNHKSISLPFYNCKFASEGPVWLHFKGRNHYAVFLKVSFNLLWELSFLELDLLQPMTLIFWGKKQAWPWPSLLPS